MARKRLKSIQFGATSALAAAASAALLLLVGCPPSPGDCPDRLRCPSDATGSSGSGGGSTSTTASASSAGGGGGMVIDPCDPTDQDNTGLTSCGIFVRNEGSDGNSGAADHPVATLAKAVELAVGKGHVYACNQTFAENLVLTKGVTLHGGLDCKAGWAYSGPLAVPTVLAPIAGVPLVLKNGPARARVRSFHLLAQPGSAPGQSSIAVIAAGSTVVIEDTRIDAGDASSGVDGVDQSMTPNPTAPDGLAGGNACTAPSVPGGSAKDNACGTSTGGKGGDGEVASGGAGGPGAPSGGAAGAGESGLGWACAPSGLGQPGAPGLDGSNGGGGLSRGQIGEDGYRGANGADGDPGKPGLAGGGGGGRAGAQCSGKAGAAGGSGAPGGCGGKGGGGGMAGGSSIGLLSAGSSVLLKNTVITTGNGGVGGRGFDAQPGADGGKGGVGGMALGGAPAGCAGGDGGPGGHGGAGGGGRGGHSIGVAHDGPLSLPEGNSIIVGSAGPGGTSKGDNDGNMGESGASLQF